MSDTKPPVSPYPPDDPREASELESLTDAVVGDADWANERAPGVAWRRVELRGTRLTGVQLAEASLLDVRLTQCRVDLAGLRFAQLERVVLSDCRMAETDLYGVKLKDVLFERCDLRGAVFSGATCERVELRGCELDGLQGVDALRGARMPVADVLANAFLFAGALEIVMLEE